MLTSSTSTGQWGYYEDQVENFNRSEKVKLNREMRLVKRKRKCGGATKGREEIADVIHEVLKRDKNHLIPFSSGHHFLCCRLIRSYPLSFFWPSWQLYINSVQNQNSRNHRPDFFCFGSKKENIYEIERICLNMFARGRCVGLARILGNSTFFFFGLCFCSSLLQKKSLWKILYSVRVLFD